MPGSARRATLAVMILVLVLLAAPVAQAKKQYPPRNPSCSVYPMQVYVGQTVTLTGKNWKPSSTVTFTYRRGTFTSSLGSTTTNSTGGFTTTAVIPSGGSGGKAYIDFIGPGPRSSSVKCTVTLKIVPAPTSSSASASTPISVTGGMLLGLGVLGLSVWLSAAHRRRARALRT